MEDARLEGHADIIEGEARSGVAYLHYCPGALTANREDHDRLWW
jgi:hypothetical protein